MSEELKPTDEQCDRIVALTMDKLAAKGCDQYGDMHALDLNPNIMEHHSLRRSIVRAAYGVGEAEAIAAWNRRAQPAAPSDEVAAVLRYCRAVQQEGTVNERVVAQTVARMLVQPEAAEPKWADGLPVSAPRLYADEEPPGHADHASKARDLFDAAPSVAPEPVAWRYQDARGHYRYRAYKPGFDVEYAILKPVPLYEAHPPRAPLSLSEISDIVSLAQIAFCLNKKPSFEVALAREVEAAHGINAEVEKP